MFGGFNRGDLLVGGLSLLAGRNFQDGVANLANVAGGAMRRNEEERKNEQRKIAITDAMRIDDPKQRQSALLAAVPEWAGPMAVEQAFATSTAPEPYTLAPGAVRYGGDNQVVASNPKGEQDDLPWYITPNGVDPRYVQAQNARAPSTVVNNNMGPDGQAYQSIGDVPEGEPIPTGLLGGYKPDTGYFAVRSAASPGGFRMMPYEDGKVDRADTNRQLRAERAGGTVVQDIGRAMEIESQPGIAGEMAVGPVAGLSRHIPGTPAHRVHQLVESALSNIGIDQLQAMRDASPTGGALGQIPVQQQARLEQMLGSLQVQQNDEDWENNARRAVNIYLDIIHGQGQGPERFDLGFDYLGRPLGPRPDGLTTEEWFNMDPEDRELFQ